MTPSVESAAPAALAPQKSPAEPLIARAAHAAFRGLWFAVIPALLAVASVRFLFPSPVDVGLGAWEEAVARFAAEHPAELFAPFFVLFALLIRRWRDRLPGGRYLSSLPLRLVPGAPKDRFDEYESAAELHAALSAVLCLPRTRGRLSVELLPVLSRALGELAEALAAGDAGRAAAARDRAEGIGRPLIAARHRAEAIGLAAVILGAAVLALALKTSVVGAYFVVSGSMLPTLRPDDHVLVNKLSYGLRAPLVAARIAERAPRRGDVVVFLRDEGDGLREHVKRVIGLPGDRITMIGLSPAINGWVVPSCNVGPYTHLSLAGKAHGRMRVEFLEDRAYLVLFGLTGPAFDDALAVRPGEVFVLGDNRSESRDSRTYNQGFGGGQPIRMIEGRVDRFLYGRRNNGGIDLRRLLSSLGTNFTLEGVTVSELERKIRTCLDKWPEQTHPPTVVGSGQAREGTQLSPSEETRL